LWKCVKDPNAGHGEPQWKTLDPRDFAPVLKEVEGLEAPSLVVPFPVVIKVPGSRSLLAEPHQMSRKVKRQLNHVSKNSSLKSHNTNQTKK